MCRLSNVGPLLLLVTLALGGCQSLPPVAKPVLGVAPITTSAPDPHAYYAMCGGRRTDLGDIIGPIAASMVAQQIPYTQDPANEWRDCSGNFLRLSSYLAEACPELNGSLAATSGIRDFEPGADNAADPASAAARTTRGIAKWYFDNHAFVPIYYDPETADRVALAKHRDFIRPGAVLWFSRQKPTKSSGLQPLFTRAINHMGTVVSVERDEDGNVVRYTMYHGRSKGKKARVTEHHYWQWPAMFTRAGKEYPPLGYWDQYLVGIAPIARA